MNLGQKIYKSTAPNGVKWVVVIGIILSFVSLYLTTLTDPKFITLANEKNFGILEFFFNYPHDFLAVIFFLILPGIYYGFIRGIIFFEKGISLNRGLPFFNRTLEYEQLASYSILHPDHLLQLKRSDTSDEVLITVRRMDRAIAILDQHLVREEIDDGNLLSRTVNANLKLIFIIVLFSIVIFTAQHLGVFRVP